MKWFDNWIRRCYNRARERDECVEVDGGWNNNPPKRGRGRLSGGTAITSTRRLEHNYDDDTVINFKVYGANGGKIVETSRYDDQKDNESVRRYVIDESADLAESLGKIITMEYLR
jgi:hypothetical protein